ncbi:MAG: hypothetical protein IK018_06780, partial [Lachnospiraceae bacterium]|nr:hypothetical protein [Lachnospiraceae bacterium]
SYTNDASRLQKWHLAYKTGVSFTNMQFSIYKQAFRLTNWHLGLQLSHEIPPFSHYHFAIT